MTRVEDGGSSFEVPDDEWAAFEVLLGEIGEHVEGGGWKADPHAPAGAHEAIERALADLRARYDSVE